MKIKIDKNIPIPNGLRVGRRVKYPFHEMKKGHSFLIKVPNSLRKKKFKARNISQSAVNFCRINNVKWKFTYRIMENGVRIWRIK